MGTIQCEWFIVVGHAFPETTVIVNQESGMRRGEERVSRGRGR